MSLARVVGVLLLAVGLPALLFFGLSFVEEARYWREHRDRLVLGSALSMYYSLEAVRIEHGRYPESLTEEPGVTAAWASLEADLQEMGHPVSEVRVTGGSTPAEGAPAREVLIASDDHDQSLLVIYSSGTIGVSRAVLTRPIENLPDWARVLE